MGKDNNPGMQLLMILRDAAPRLILVAGMITALTDISHGATFLYGVIVLYAWKVFKWHSKQLED